MSRREVLALGIILPNTTINNVNSPSQNTTVANNTVTNTTVRMATAIIATQVNPFYDIIDLSSAEGKKLYQKATQDLSED